MRLFAFADRKEQGGWRFKNSQWEQMVQCRPRGIQCPISWCEGGELAYPP
jgi:hypothetical protein